MDYNQLAIEMIKDLRQQVSQQNLSHRLGYSYNIVHRWEKARKSILWQDYLQVCLLMKVPVESTLKRLYALEGSVDESNLLISNLCKGESLKDLSAKLEISKNILHNYISGKTEPKLSFVLKLINQKTIFGVKDLIDNIHTAVLINKFFPGHGRVYEFNAIVNKNPKIGLLASALRLDFYQQSKHHDEEFLAKIIKDSVKNLRSYLSILETLKVIKKENHKYTVIDGPGLISLQNYTTEELLKLDRYWMEESFKYFERFLPEDRVGAKIGYLRLTLDQETLDELDELTMKYFKDVQSLANKKKKSEVIRVLNFNYFDPLA